MLPILLATLASFSSVGTKQFPVKGIGLSVCETNNSYTQNVSYLVTAYYKERVPYVSMGYSQEQYTQESYTEQECISVPYMERECAQEQIAYSITDKTCYRTGWQQNWSNIQCTLKNIDSVGGNFTVFTGIGTDLDKYMFIPSNGWVSFTQNGQTSTAYLYPGASKTFDYHLLLEKPTTPFICYCYVVSGSTKEVCSYVQKTMQKCHVVVKSPSLAAGSPTGAAVDPRDISYKNELKGTSVVKYRTETKYEVVDEFC
jgi:hypothetical protein